MAVYQIGDRTPEIEPDAFVHVQATVIGMVALSKGASVWPQAVLRGDNELIAIGPHSNVQDGAVLHTDPGFPMTIGANVSIGHQAMLHGCTVGDGSLIGIQAIVMNGAVIGRNCLVGAGALITERKTFPDNSLIFGRPAQVVRPLTEDEVALLRLTASGYVLRAAHYRDHLTRLD